MIDILNSISSEFNADEPVKLIRRFLSIARRRYLDATLTDDDRRLLLRAGCLPDADEDTRGGPINEQALLSLSDKYEVIWDDWRWHLANRMHPGREASDTDIELLLSSIRESILGSEISKRSFRRIIKNGVKETRGSGRRYYDFSLLPLNLLLGESVLRYFIPPSDYLQPHITKKADPYGLLWSTSRAATAEGHPTAVISPEDRRLLGAHKFSHTLLMNVDFYCPIGCSDCYKTRFGTREYTTPGKRKAERASIYYHPDYGTVSPPSAGEIAEHARRVVTWMNHDTRGQAVYDVIISGGEPFVLDDEKLEAVLAEMENARNLQILRICTGTIFLGLPMRITDKLADMLEEFSKRTGVRVTIQAHLACHEQIVAESYQAVSRFRKRGISVYSQTPIKDGINFFLGKQRETMASLSALCRKQVAVGVEPYMFIVDMHPSTNGFYVPLEPLLAAWGDLVESHDFPGLERPRTLSILFERGNVILSGSNLLSMRKVVDRQAGVVTYRIPRVGLSESGMPAIAEVFEYQEPLGHYNDDPDSLDRLRALSLHS